MAYKYIFLSADRVISNAIVSSIELTQEQINTISSILGASYEPEPFSYGPVPFEQLVGSYTYSSDIYNRAYIPYVRILSKYAFNSRFTLDELSAIQIAAKTDSVVAVLQTKFTIADEINLDEAVVSDGLDILVGYGLLTVQRKAEIMA